MKDEIMQYFQSDRSFDTAKKLYNKLPGGSASLRRMINMRGETAENHKQLNYELAKHAGINERVMEAMLRRALVEVEETTDEAAGNEAEAINTLPEDFPHRAKLEKLEEPITSIEQIIAIEKLSAIKGIGAKMEADILEYMSTFDVESLGKLNAPTATDGRRGYRLLEKQYPFLLKSSCPAELRQLAQLSVESHQVYVKAHAKLHDADTKESMEEIVRLCVQSHILNRAAHKELSHFLKTGSPLQEHPVWLERKLREEFAAMPGKELLKEYNNLVKARNKLRARIRTEENEELNDSRREKISEKELRMKLINERLDQL